MSPRHQAAQTAHILFTVVVWTSPTAPSFKLARRVCFLRWCIEASIPPSGVSVALSGAMSIVHLVTLQQISTTKIAICNSLLCVVASEVTLSVSATDQENQDRSV